MNRFERWLAIKAAAHFLKGLGMNPLPKWFGVVTWFITNAGVIFAAYQTGGVKGVIIAIVGLLTTTGTLAAHSITGTGGRPS